MKNTQRRQRMMIKITTPTITNVAMIFDGLPQKPLLLSELSLLLLLPLLPTLAVLFLDNPEDEEVDDEEDDVAGGEDTFVVVTTTIWVLYT